MTNNTSLPGFVGYGVRGLVGENGKNGVSYHYTPYSIQVSDSVDINDLNTEFIDKLRNNFKINSINSFEKLNDDRVYNARDIICDSSGYLYVYQGDAQISKMTHIENGVVSHTSINLNSIFDFSSKYYNSNYYRRVFNNKTSSIDALYSNDRVEYVNMKTVYNNNILDFNTNTITNYIVNSTIPFKVFNNNYSSMSFVLNNINNNVIIHSDAHVLLDINRLTVPNQTIIGNEYVYNGINDTSLLNRFNPDFINSNNFKISLIDDYYNISFDPKLLFNKFGQYDNLELEELYMNIYTIYGDYKSKNTPTTVIKGINILDQSDFKRVKIRRDDKNPMYMYIQIINSNGTYVTSQITNKSINKL